MTENINANTDFSKFTHCELINVQKRHKPESIVYIKAKCELEHREYIRNQKNDKITFIILILTTITAIITITPLALILFNIFLS